MPTRPEECRFCGPSVLTEVENAPEGWWFRCTKCGSYLNADVADSPTFYGGGYYTRRDHLHNWFDGQASLENMRAQLYLNRKWPWRVPWLLRVIRRAGMRSTESVVDWGCGYHGMYVDLLRVYGFRAEGYDPYSSQFSTKPEGEFDWMFTRYSLEHMADPVEALLSVRARKSVHVLPLADAPAMMMQTHINLCPSHHFVPSLSVAIDLLGEGGWMVQDWWLDDNREGAIFVCKRWNL